MLALIVAATEQPTQRAVKGPKKYYSGKKKRHTIKTELVIEESGKILSVSKAYKGSTHDFKVRKTEKLLPMGSVKMADSGYQGWQELQSNIKIPYKRTKNNPLTKDQKEYNRSLSSLRVRVEHKIREIKVFKIMSDTYRNFQKKHNLRFNIIAGLVNLKHAF